MFNFFMYCTTLTCNVFRVKLGAEVEVIMFLSERVMLFLLDLHWVLLRWVCMLTQIAVLGLWFIVSLSKICCLKDGEKMHLVSSTLS